VTRAREGRSTAVIVIAIIIVIVIAGTATAPRPSPPPPARRNRWCRRNCLHRRPIVLTSAGGDPTG